MTKMRKIYSAECKKCRESFRMKPEEIKIEKKLFFEYLSFTCPECKHRNNKIYNFTVTIEIPTIED